MKKLFILVIFILASITLKAKEIYHVNTERLNIRANPYARSPSIGYVLYGQNVEVIDKTNPDWYKIKLTNLTGYVKSDLITKNISKNSNLDVTRHNLKVVAIAVTVLILLVLFYYLFNGNNKNIRQMGNGYNTITHKQVSIKRKSVGIAILLTLFLGPFGMFYSTTKGAFTMILTPIVGSIILITLVSSDSLFLGIFVLGGLVVYASFYWLICIVWAAVAAGNS